MAKPRRRAEGKYPPGSLVVTQMLSEGANVLKVIDNPQQIAAFWDLLHQLEKQPPPADQSPRPRKSRSRRDPFFRTGPCG
ncbi:MAG: hypothetical protein PHI63_03680 [Patescibacteria group bacterium]|nr:hypothetical protein [Patescibacteria group bacterium]